MKILLLLIGLGFSISSHAESARYFSSSYGDIDLVALEQEIEALTHNADVQDLTMRRSYNPVDRIFINSLSRFRYYVIHFTINEIHHFECHLVLVKDLNKAMVNDCFSETADLNASGFIEISDIGLAPITEPKAQFN